MDILNDLYPIVATASLAHEAHSRIHHEMRRIAERHLILAAKAHEDAAYLPVAEATFAMWVALEAAERAAWAAYQAAKDANL